MLVDLHLHLRGTINAETARRLAIKNGVSLPDRLLATPGYGWTDFTSFLEVYDQIASTIVTGDDIQAVTYNHLSKIAAEDTGYVEFMISTPHDGRSQLLYEHQLAAVDAAAERAYSETGIECRIIATAVRHLGPEAAMIAARTAVRGGSRRLVGFGLTGDERQYNIESFRPAFEVARADGLKVTAHAGEHLGADAIIGAIEALELDRVGHGVRAVESESVLKYLADWQIPLEVCISSNLGLGLYTGIDTHPVAVLAQVGCSVTLGTDDPAFFATSPSKEYRLALHASSKLSANYVSQNAIRAAFCDEQTKMRLMSRLST